MPEAEDLALLEGAARQAGEVALRYWRKDPEFWDKGGDAGPVSEADLAVNEALRSLLQQERPDYGWLSEESPDAPDRLAAERLFILDPIDGTRAFLNRDEDYSISLAVVEAGHPIAGVVFLPAKNRLYSATANGPALRDGEILRCSDRAELTGAELLCNRAALAPELWPGGVPEIKRKFRSSIAYRLCLVAEGRYDAMLTLRPSWEWDIAAGSLVATRAGCRVTDRSGGSLSFNAPHPQVNGVVAAGAALQEQLLQRLKV